ncbi:MAG: hypothetical protein NXI32_07685 [bacterium]|nr:hypothetical protein [bacterium]
MLGITLLAIVATVLCYKAFLKHFDAGLHKIVKNHLIEIFPEARVGMSNVTQDAEGSIVVTNLSLMDKQDRELPPVLTADRVIIRGKLQVQNVLRDDIAVTQVELTGVLCDIWPTAQGGWSAKVIAPKPKPNACPPRILVHNAIIRLHKSRDSGAPVTTFHNVEATLEQSAHSTQGSDPKMILAKVSGQSANTIDDLTLTANISRSTNSWKLHGDIQQLHFSQTLLARLPDELAGYMMQLAGLECVASAQFQVESSQGEPAVFRVLGQIRDGRLQDARLPYPLDNIQSEFSCENSQLQLRNMHAESGATKLALNTDIFGLGLNSPLAIEAKVVNLDLDQRLYQSLPQDLQEHWNKLELSGRVSGDMKLFFDGQRWTPSIFVRCQGVNIRPWLFPFPVTDVHGDIQYQDRRIQSQHVQGSAGGQQVHASFAFEQSSEPQADGKKPWFGRLDCQSDGPVSIDEQLLQALTPSDRSATTGAEKFVRSLHPSGTIQLTGASFQRQSAADIWHKKIEANVYSGSIQYEGFRYPIYDIRGHIACNDDNWWLDQFEGRNDSGRILCSGSWVTRPNEVPFHLKFNAFAVPMEEELKLALPKETQFVWSELQPLGSIDRVEVQLQKLAGDSQVSTTVQVIEESRSNVASGRSLRLKPKAFPYWLTDVDCRISYSPGLVVIHKASGVNGASRIAIRGTCEPVADGRWKAKVDWLPQTRLLVESELLKALPKSIRESLVKIDFRGPISILGQSEVVFADAQQGRIASAWNCRVAVEDCQLADGRYLGALRGSLLVQGYSDGSQIKATGAIDLDALTVLGIPVTRLAGPFALLGSDLYFGKQVYEALPPTDPTQIREMTANALTGKLSLSGYGKLDQGKFTFQSKLRSANLNLLLKDLGVEHATAQANCDAELSFTGVPWNPQTYTGEGHVHLSDAQLYELPFMIRLLSVASVSAKSDSAFQTADIRFRIDGDRIPLQVACDGDLLRLRGEGETNLRRDIRLDLYSYVGRRMPLQQVVSPFLGEHRYPTLMLIEVDGSWSNPTMRQRFPQIEETLQQIFPDVADSAGSTRYR